MVRGHFPSGEGMGPPTQHLIAMEIQLALPPESLSLGPVSRLLLLAKSLGLGAYWLSRSYACRGKEGLATN